MKHSASCAKHLDLDFVAERCELVSKRDVKFVDILFTNFKVTKSARTSTLKNRHIVAYVTKLDDFYLLGKKNSYKSCPNILEKIGLF